MKSLSREKGSWTMIMLRTEVRSHFCARGDRSRSETRLREESERSKRT